MSLAAISITAMPAGRHVQIVPVWMRPTDVSDDGWHTTAVSPAGGQLPDRTASISPSHVLVMSALTLRTRRHPTQSSRRAFGKAVVQRKAKGRLQAARKMRSMRRLETSSGAATALSALLATNDDTFTCHDFCWNGFS